VEPVELAEPAEPVFFASMFSYSKYYYFATEYPTPKIDNKFKKIYILKGKK
jgi:hypothetical protein